MLGHFLATLCRMVSLQFVWYSLQSVRHLPCRRSAFYPFVVKLAVGIPRGRHSECYPK